MKIYDWKRFLTFIAVVIFLIIVMLYGCTKKPEVKETIEYEVQSGETLWEISKRYCPSEMSLQEYVYNIRELNNEDDCIIYPKQVLKILIYEEV